jgi:DNA ligase-4
LNHHRPFPPKFGKQLFRLLYPHEGSRRRYGLKETKLSKELEGILGLSGLSRWDGVVYEGEAGTGCLGREVETMMRPRVSHLLLLLK